MNKNKIVKSVILILILFLIATFINSVFITSFAGSEFDWKQAVTDFSDSTGNEEANNATKGIMGAVATIVRIVGMGIAVIMLVVLAMKYMVAAPGDKADIKKHAVVYVVGAVVLFAATNILAIIAEFTAKNVKVGE